MDAIEAIMTRRSHERLGEPAPDGAQLRTLVEAACAAPDHGKLRPWRFTFVRGDGRCRLGEVLEAAYRRRCYETGSEPLPAVAGKEQTNLLRAPLIVIVSAVPQPSDHIPWSDQRAAVAAAVQNLLVAAHALGFGAMWRTGDTRADPTVKHALGRRDEDEIVGYVYLGTPLRPKAPRNLDVDPWVSTYPP